MDFPEPVLPMIAVVCPGSAAARRHAAQGSPRAVVNSTSRSSTATGPAGSGLGSGSATTLESVSRTSVIRPAETVALGTIIDMKVAIMTAIRICIRYDMKAVSSPICIWPLSTRCPPNHSTATVEVLNTSMTSGKASDMSRPTASAVPVYCVLAAAKRSRSCSSRTKALTTRTPVICSRRTC